jgi:hypothetical protein
MAFANDEMRRILAISFGAADHRKQVIDHLTNQRRDV